MDIDVSYEYGGRTFLSRPGAKAKFFNLPDVPPDRKSEMERWATCQLACMLAIMVAEVFSIAVRKSLIDASTEYVRTVASVIQGAADKESTIVLN